MSAWEPLRPNERNGVWGQILETAQLSLFCHQSFPGIKSRAVNQTQQVFIWLQSVWHTPADAWLWGASVAASLRHQTGSLCADVASGGILKVRSEQSNRWWETSCWQQFEFEFARKRHKCVWWCDVCLVLHTSLFYVTSTRRAAQVEPALGKMYDLKRGVWISLRAFRREIQSC